MYLTNFSFLAISPIICMQCISTTRLKICYKRFTRYLRFIYRTMPVQITILLHFFLMLPVMKSEMMVSENVF